MRESALGLSKGKFVAPFTYGGTIKALLFEQQFKDRQLKALPKVRVIIMDNAAFRKKEGLHGIAKEHSQTLIFPAAVFAGTQSH